MYPADQIALAQVRALPAPAEAEPTALTTLWNGTGSNVSGWVINVGAAGKEFEVETDRVAAVTLAPGEFFGVDNASQVIITTGTDGCQAAWILMHSGQPAAADK